MKKHIPKKSLGQNFLRDEKALEKIVSAADLSVDDNVLEIGPGTGALSERLVKNAGRVLMIEKDEELARQLASDLRFKIYDLRNKSTIDNRQSTIEIKNSLVQNDW